MSDIQLSPQLFSDIQAAVEKQQPDADPGTTMQYLAAVMGYILASQGGMSREERDEYMNQLCEFARHVVSDVVARQTPARPAAPPGQQAFGIWEPSR